VVKSPRRVRSPRLCPTADFHVYKTFERLAADGITKENTLFVVTADEGDHASLNISTRALASGDADNDST
jgi:hypothetical protein